MTLLEKAQSAIAELDGQSWPPCDRLAELRILRDDIEDRIWNIKLATGIGLWRENQ
jgi:hypothetical protein